MALTPIAEWHCREGTEKMLIDEPIPLAYGVRINPCTAPAESV